MITAWLNWKKHPNFIWFTPWIQVSFSLPSYLISEITSSKSLQHYKVGPYDRYTWGKITPVSRVKSPQAKPFHFRPFIGGYDYNLIYNDRFPAPPLYQCWWFSSALLLHLNDLPYFGSQLEIAACLPSAHAAAWKLRFASRREFTFFQSGKSDNYKTIWKLQKNLKFSETIPLRIQIFLCPKISLLDSPKWQSYDLGYLERCFDHREETWILSCCATS